MKTYLAEVSYTVLQPEEKEVTWKSVNKYATEEPARIELDAVAKNISRTNSITNAQVVEEEQEDTLVMEGVVGDNGCQYGDYALVLVDEKGPGYSRLIENEIGSIYKGRRVRITVELIDEPNN